MGKNKLTLCSRQISSVFHSQKREKIIFSTKIEKNGNFHKILSLANDVNNFMRPRGHEAENELMTEFFMEFVIAFFLVSQKMIAIEVIKL